MPVKATADAARRFLMARQFLAPARCLEGGTDAVLEVFRTFGSIQFDPIAVAGRNHDVVLHARVADGFVDAMRAALRAYLRFACASKIEWPSHLGAEKRLFPVRA